MKLTIAGGDKRMLTVAENLAKEGYNVSVFGFDKYNISKPGIEYAEDVPSALFNSKAVILPYPCEKDGFLNLPLSSRTLKMADIFAMADKEAIFIGGKMEQTGENFIDYSQNEDYLLKNALITAEAALKIAIELLDITIFGANAVVLGYGRIGRFLANMLKSLGANTTVAARSITSRTLANISGVDAVGFEDIEAPLKRAHIIFNTIPHKVIGENELKFIKKGRAIVDLASLPGGATEKECDKQGINLIRALGLPGKTAPVSAGEAVFQTILPILKKRGITI